MGGGGGGAYHRQFTVFEAVTKMGKSSPDKAKSVILYFVSICFINFAFNFLVSSLTNVTNVRPYKCHIRCKEFFIEDISRRSEDMIFDFQW